MKKWMTILLGLILAFSICGAVFGSTSAAENKPSYYMSVEVRKGDTVWSIAKTHNHSELSTQIYVERIKEFNKMDGDKILPGQKLQVPIF